MHLRLFRYRRDSDQAAYLSQLPSQKTLARGTAGLFFPIHSILHLEPDPDVCSQLRSQELLHPAHLDLFQRSRGVRGRKPESHG